MSSSFLILLMMGSYENIITQKPSFDDFDGGRGGGNRTRANGFGDRCTTIIRRPFVFDLL